MNLPDWQRAGFSLKGNTLIKESSKEARTLHPKLAKRIRQDTKPLLNKLESEWHTILKEAYPEGTIIIAQGIRFRLGNGIWYKPDFVVFGIKTYAYEVKGPKSWRGGFENLKVAASQYVNIRWSLIWKEGFHWQEQEVMP